MLYNCFTSLQEYNAEEKLLPLAPELLPLNFIWYIHVELIKHLKTQVWMTGMEK